MAQHTSLTYLGTTPACGPSSATTYDFVWTDRRLRDAPQRELGTPLSARLKWQPLSRMLEWCKTSNRDALTDARPDLLGPFILTYVQRVCMGPSCKMTTAAVDEMRTSLMLTSARSRSSPSPSPCSQGEPRVAQLDAPHAAEPRVARSLLHVPVLLTSGHRKESTLALADTGARMDVISREMATRLVPKRLWTSLRTPLTAQGALAGTTTSIAHFVTVAVTLGEKGTQFTEERAFFVMDTDLPLILGKVCVVRGPRTARPPGELVREHPRLRAPRP